MTHSHTPGPWFPATGWVGAGTLQDLQTCRVIARIGGYPHGSTVANTHLIAAAPDMLAALRELVQLLTTMQMGYEHDSRVIMGQAVIAKAEGRS